MEESCNCRRTRCLQCYCDCFRMHKYCTDKCGCISCHNTPSHEAEVEEETEMIKRKNSYKLKLEPGDAAPRQLKGCNCGKSKCVKMYCECYKNGLGCTSRCQCKQCENEYGRSGDAPKLGPEHSGNPLEGTSRSDNHMQIVPFEVDDYEANGTAKVGQCDMPLNDSSASQMFSDSNRLAGNGGYPLLTFLPAYDEPALEMQPLGSSNMHPSLVYMPMDANGSLVDSWDQLPSSEAFGYHGPLVHDQYPNWNPGSVSQHQLEFGGMLHHPASSHNLFVNGYNLLQYDQSTQDISQSEANKQLGTAQPSGVVERNPSTPDSLQSQIQTPLAAAEPSGAVEPSK